MLVLTVTVAVGNEVLKDPRNPCSPGCAGPLPGALTVGAPTNSPSAAGRSRQSHVANPEMAFRSGPEKAEIGEGSREGEKTERDVVVDQGVVEQT